MFQSTTTSRKRIQTMTKEKFRCGSCYSILKKINETNQYYCDQPLSTCIDSLKTIVIQ